MDFKFLEQLMEKYPNIKRFKQGECELEFYPAKESMEITPKSFHDLTENGMPPEDEMLLYSTSHFDEIRAQRKTDEPNFQFPSKAGS